MKASKIMALLGIIGLVITAKLWSNARAYDAHIQQSVGSFLRWSDESAAEKLRITGKDVRNDSLFKSGKALGRTAGIVGRAEAFAPPVVAFSISVLLLVLSVIEELGRRKRSSPMAARQSGGHCCQHGR